MTRRVVLYLRLSRSTDASTALDRQNADLREYVTRKGWEVVRVLEDDGKSGRKRRTNADECLRMLRDREADTLAVAAVDRWTREGLEAVGELCGVLRQSGAQFFALRENLTSTDDTFELTLGIHASIAKREGELIASRVASSRKHLDQLGRFKGGIVPFGYRPVRREAGVFLEHDPEEVQWVEHIVTSALSGLSLTAITATLRAAKVPTTKSKARGARQRGESTDGLDRGTWHLQIVRKLIASPTIVGWTTTGGKGGLHERERPVVRDATGAPKVVAPGIIDAETHARVLAAFPQGRPQRTRAARILSGIAYCQCGAKGYVMHEGGTIIYRCAARSMDVDATCTGPRINAESLERYVVERYLSRNGSLPEFKTVEHVENGATAAELADIEAALGDASAAMLEDGADLSALAARIGALKERRETLRKVPVSITTTRTPTGRTLADAWADASTVAAQNELLADALHYVEFHSYTVPNTPERRTRLEWAIDDMPINFVDADEDLDATIRARR